MELSSEWMLRAPLAERMLAMEENTRPTLELERVQHYRFPKVTFVLTNLRAPPSVAQHVQCALIRVAQGVSCAEPTCGMACAACSTH